LADGAPSQAHRPKAATASTPHPNRRDRTVALIKDMFPSIRGPFQAALNAWNKLRTKRGVCPEKDYPLDPPNSLTPHMEIEKWISKKQSLSDTFFGD
jgi:hypothetical protein